MRVNQSFWMVVAVVFIMLAASAQAQVPQVINYQAQLANASGPLSGVHTIVFAIYDAPTGGNKLPIGSPWEETHTVDIATSANGFFEVYLGKSTTAPVPIPLDIFDSGTERYLQLTVDGEILSQRKQFGSVPYAFRSRETGGGGSGGWTDDGTVVRLTTSTDNVGIGTDMPQSKLHVKGDNPVRILGDLTTLSGEEYVDFMARNSPFGTDIGGMRIQRDPAGNVNTSFFAAAAENPASEKMRIGGNGYVGIGITSPEYQLHVKGNDEVRIMGDLSTLSGSEKVDFMARNSQFNSEIGGMRIQRDAAGNVNTSFFAAAAGSGASEKVFIGGNGKVGIGMTNPEAQLDVAGYARATTALIGSLSTLGLPAFFGHTGLDHTSFNNYAIAQQSNGMTFLNAAAGQQIFFGIGGQTKMTLASNGTLTTQVLQITGGSDLSEQFEINSAKEAGSEAALEQALPGMVVSINPEQPGKLVISTKAYDRKVAGIISGAGGIATGMLMGQDGSTANGSTPVALAGRVYCWVDASFGAIKPGDLLTSSDTPGHAMKVGDHAQAQGAILGKAMTGLDKGKGLVLVLVTLQ